MMKLPRFFFALVLCSCLIAPSFANGVDKAAVVPSPKVYELTDGFFTLPRVFSVGGIFSASAMKYLGVRGLHVVASENEATILASLDSSLPAEGYSLEISSEGIIIKAADEAGVMYAVETLSQILDQASGACVKSCVISDSPRFQYRGMMLDVVRCFLPIEEVKNFIDVASRLKINKLHLHLTDDNGWRLEIKKYPKLTEVGAWRVDRGEVFPARPNPKEGEPATYGGFYTQAQMIDLVSYASDRNVEIIPEIEMPAHSIGAIASYPELACPVSDDFIGVLPGIGGKAASIIMCAGNDATLSFVKDVLDEVMSIFPSEYIHLGGDEANKARWEICPRCQERISKEHLDDCEALQGWFMDQIISYVNSKGKRAIGWDEVTYGLPKQDITIMGWQGTGVVAEKYARLTGRRFILTPARATYFIRYQGPQWFEPFTYFGNITLKDVYEFEPVKPDWTDSMRTQLWGVQGSMWTEFCRLPSDVQYMVFPRLIALADVAWREEGRRDWTGFVRAVDCFLPRLAEKGMDFARSMWNIQHTAVPDGKGNVIVSLANERPDAHIAVSDNREMSNSSVYNGALTIDADTHLFCIASASGVSGEVLSLDVKFNSATGRIAQCDTCTNGLGRVLTNGVRGSFRNSDFEWAGWYDGTASFTVDLGEVAMVNSVSLGTLANANMNVALPKTITLSISTDNHKFKRLKTLEFADIERFPLDAQVRDIDFGSIKKKARYVRIVAENGGPVPDGFPREGNSTWLYFDELIVK